MNRPMKCFVDSLMLGVSALVLAAVALVSIALFGRVMDSEVPCRFVKAAVFVLTCSIVCGCVAAVVVWISRRAESLDEGCDS